MLMCGAETWLWNKAVCPFVGAHGIGSVVTKFSCDQMPLNLCIIYCCSELSFSFDNDVRDG
jgi:hypothetical protein